MEYIFSYICTCAFLILERTRNPAPSMILVLLVHRLIVYTCYYIFKVVTSLSFVRIEHYAQTCASA